MAPRAADPRVGYFTTTVADFTDDLARTPRERFINRWRLEKKDPAAPAIAKPKSGRGFSRKQLAEGLEGKALPKRARAKILRSINAQLEKAKQPAATMKDVFGEDAIKKGESKAPVKKNG